MSEHDVAKMIEDYGEAFNKHEMPRLMAFYADDCVHNDSFVGTLQGKDEIREHLTGMFNAFPDLEMTIETAIGGEDLVAIEATIAGTNKGTLPPPIDLPATNRRMELSCAMFLSLEGGKVTVENVYADFGVMLEELGIAPLEAEAEDDQAQESRR